MPATILSDNGASSGTAGLKTSGSNDGILELQTTTGGGTATTAVSINTTQQVAFTAGTAAAPSITPSGDPNTGIFFPAADTIAFAEGGTEAMRIDSSGQVAIGTTTANDTLTVGGNNAYIRIDRTANEPGIDMRVGGSTTNRGVIAVTTGGALYFASGGSTERARFNTTGAFVFAGGTTTANGIGITFPATQSASTNANTLDDYEEGTYTPGYANFSTTGTVTITGRYIKIGRSVFFSVVFSSTGTIGFSTSAFIDVPFSGQQHSSSITMRLDSNSSAQNSNQAGTQMNTGEVSFTRFFVGSFTATSSGQSLIFAGNYEAQS